MDQDGKVDGTSDNRKSSLRAHGVASRGRIEMPTKAPNELSRGLSSSVAPKSEKVVNTLRKFGRTSRPPESEATESP